jgi:hypothetical protein
MEKKCRGKNHHKGLTFLHLGQQGTFTVDWIGGNKVETGRQSQAVWTTSWTAERPWHSLLVPPTHSNHTTPHNITFPPTIRRNYTELQLLSSAISRLWSWLLAPRPRPSAPLLPSMHPLIQAFCGWTSPRWANDDDVSARLKTSLLKTTGIVGCRGLTSRAYKLDDEVHYSQSWWVCMLDVLVAAGWITNGYQDARLV